MEGYSAKDSGTEANQSRERERAVRARARRCAGRTACH